MSERSKQKERKIKVLVENYNRKTKESEIGRLEKLHLTPDELKDILLEIPTKSEVSDNFGFYDPYTDSNIIENPIVDKFLDFFDDTEEIEDHGFHTKIITNDFVISKKGDNSYECLKKYSKLYFLKIPLYRKETVSLDEFPELEKKKKFYILINIFLPFIFPSLFLFYFIWALLFYIDKFDVNIFFLLLWGWFFSLAIINLLYSLIFHYKKEKMEYYNPLLRMFKPYDLSKFIILIVLCVGVIYLGLFFLILGYTEVVVVVEQVELTQEQQELIPTISGITLLIIIILIYFREKISDFLNKIFIALFWLISAPFHIIYIYYKFNKEKKDYILHNLNIHLQEEDLKPEIKNYYFQLMLEIGKIPIIRIDLFSKLITLLTFLISTIPPFINQFLL